MVVLLQKIKESYDYVFYDLADERTRDMFPSALFLMITLPSYLYFSKSLGPRIMKDLKPFKLRTIIKYYNLFQVFICVYMFQLVALAVVSSRLVQPGRNVNHLCIKVNCMIVAIKGGWFNGNSFFCQPDDYSVNPKTTAMLNAAWWYTTVKLIDLLDTIFFVLRKKDRQISFLHVFHHFMMPIAAFIGFKYFPTGHATLVGVINCLVHVVMYTYYFIAGLGPKYQKYLWWKKHVTTMQLVQFCIIFVHNLVALCDSTCGYPKWINVLLCIHSLQFIYMFGSFYYVNYIIKPKTAANGTPNGVPKTTNEKLKGY